MHRWRDQRDVSWALRGVDSRLAESVPRLDDKHSSQLSVHPEIRIGKVSGNTVSELASTGALASYPDESIHNTGYPQRYCMKCDHTYTEYE